MLWGGTMKTTKIDLFKALCRIWQGHCLTQRPFALTYANGNALLATKLRKRGAYG